MLGVSLIRAAIDDAEINKIFAVIRPGSTKIGLLPTSEKVKIIECRIDEYDKLIERIDCPVDIFFHLAWPRTATYDESFDDTYEKAHNILYVLDALKVSHSLGCSVFVGAGSQSEYGIIDSGKITIDSPCNPVRNDGVIHLAAGRLVGMTASKMEIASAWVRIFSLYGTNDRDNSLIKSTIRKLRQDNTCSFTEAIQMWDYLYEDDAGRAFLEIGKKVKGNKVYNLGYGESQTLRQYITCIRDLVNPEAQLLFGEIPYPPNPIMNLQCDITPLTEDTGWIPKTPFEEGIRRMIQEVHDV